MANLDAILKSFADSAKYEIQMQPSSGQSSPQFTECATPSDYHVLSTPTPSSGPVGTSVTVFATGLTANSAISSVKVGSATVTSFDPTPTSTDNNGDITLTFAIPGGLSPGTAYPLIVTDANGISESSTGDFMVTPGAPSPSLSALTGYSVSMNSVKWWNGSTFVPSSGVSAPADKTGIQLITATAEAQDHTTSSLSFVVSNPGTTAPTIVSVLAYFIVGTPANFQVVYTGYPAPVFVSNGTLPPGISLSPSGLLTGVPTIGGTYTFTITATNTKASYSQQFTAVVYQPPAITSANSAAFNTGSAGTFTVTTTGYPTPVINDSPFAGCTPSSLPNSITFTDNGNGTATIKATNTAPQGTYTLCLNATNTDPGNGQQTTSTQIFHLYVGTSPSFTSTSTATFTAGATNAFTVTTSGYPAPAITNTGFAGCTPTTLPNSITVTDNGNGTATIKATNTAPQGTYTLCLNATNQLGTTTQTFTLVIGSAPTFTSANSVGFQIGTASTFSVTTSGYPAPAITNTGFAGCTPTTLPNSITVTDNGNGTATIKATNTAPQGTYTLCLNATNQLGTTTQTFTLVIGSAPTFTSANSVGFQIGTASTFSVTTSGYPAPAITNTGFAGCTPTTLPNSITVTDNGNGTATIKATNTAPRGTYTLCLNATNQLGTTTQTFTLTIGVAPTITGPTTVHFPIGADTSYTYSTTGSPTLSITAGSLPPSGDITFDTTTGALSGRARNRDRGTYTITITATNAYGSASITVTVMVP